MLYWVKQVEHITDVIKKTKWSCFVEKPTEDFLAFLSAFATVTLEDPPEEFLKEELVRIEKEMTKLLAIKNDVEKRLKKE